MDHPVAASSAAEADVFQGQQPTLDEYNSYRQSGKLPERFKPAESAESAPADAPEETATPEIDGESETPAEQHQEPTPKLTAKQRKAQIEARIEQEWNKPEPDVLAIAKLEATKDRIEAGVKRKTEPAPVTQSAAPPTNQSQPAPPQNYQDYRKAFQPSKFIEEFAKANPQATYDDANAAMADHLSDVRDHFRNIEQQAQATKQNLDAQVKDAQERYENFDEIKQTFLDQVIGEKGMPLIPPIVLSVINDSDYLTDLLYTLGSDEAEVAKFVALAKSDPRRAIRYVARVEALIEEELAGKEPDGKAPEPKKTAAPKPPSPVSGSNSRAFDVNDDSLSPEEWMRKRNSQLARKT